MLIPLKIPIVFVFIFQSAFQYVDSTQQQVCELEEKNAKKIKTKVTIWQEETSENALGQDKRGEQALGQDEQD